VARRDKREPSPQSPSKRKERPERDPGAAKQPPRRPALPGADSSDDRLCWRFTHVDHDGPWGFGDTDTASLRQIMNGLANFESMTVNEAFLRGGYPGKDYDVEAIPTKAAHDRLEAMGMPDMTKIWALRLGGEPRLWGFLLGNIFHVVWWDPRHEIWPSTLKHT
jgi:hypothetical protein